MTKGMIYTEEELQAAKDNINEIAFKAEKVAYFINKQNAWNEVQLRRRRDAELLVQKKDEEIEDLKEQVDVRRAIYDNLFRVYDAAKTEIHKLNDKLDDRDRLIENLQKEIKKQKRLVREMQGVRYIALLPELDEEEQIDDQEN